MRFRTARYVALGLFLIGSAVLAAEEGVKVASFSGKGVWQSGEEGPVEVLMEGATLSQGDTVSIGSGSNITLEFADGALMDVTGPSRLTLELVADYARTVRLTEGTVNRLVVKEVTTGIVTPGGAFAVTQNGTIFARAERGGTDGSVRSTFKLFEGDTAKTGIKGGAVSIMTTDKPVVFDLAGPRPTPTVVAAPRPSGDGPKIELGIHDIEYFPAGGVTVEVTPGGGRKLTSTAPEGEYSIIIIDEDTTFYLAAGESVSFNANGAVENHNGVVHVYAPLSITAFWFDPVRDPAGSSFTGNAIK
jgi:hypothetical protein